MNNNKIKDLIFKVAAVLIVFAAILYSFDPVIAAYIMIGASLVYIVCVFTSRYAGKSLRGKRLYNINVFGAIFMGVSAYLMYEQNNKWPLILLISAVLTLYSTLMLSKVIREDAEQ